MSARGQILAVLVCGGLLLAASTGAAYAQDTVSIGKVSFSPDRLGAATDVFGSATIGSTDGPMPSPITHVDVYGPAGVTLDLEGSTKCDQAFLERTGTCPKNSRAGTGGGEGLYELGGEIIREKYTFELFLTDNRPGHTKMVVYLVGHTPASIEIYFDATVISGPKPYGLGFSLDVPLIQPLPEASYASASSAFLHLGAKGQTYSKMVHGKREQLPIKGIILPRTCPHKGWAVASQFSFLDGSTVTAKRDVPCPKR
jgi:hypothetical protein